MAQPVYWIGQNGNIYYGSGAAGAPVQNLGSATNGQFSVRPDGLYDNFTDNGVPKLTFAATQIADPSAPPAHTAAPTGGTPNPPLDQAAVDNTQKSIDALPGILQAALASENTQYGNTTGGYDAAEQQQQGQYDQNSTSNQQNYDSAFMSAIRAGIKGLSGLFALLRGTGAAGGSADKSVKDLVGATTSNDIQTGQTTRDTNQTGLDQSLGSFLTDLKGKRQAAADTHANNATAIQHDSNTGLQDLYSKMAGFYSAAGDTANATDWMNRAGDLTPTIASESSKTVTPFDNSPVIVHAPNLTTFAPPTQPSVVTQPDSGQVGSGIFTISPPSKKTQTATPAPAGA